MLLLSCFDVVLGMEEVAQPLRHHLQQCQEGAEVDGNLDRQREQEANGVKFNFAHLPIVRHQPAMA